MLACTIAALAVVLPGAWFTAGVPAVCGVLVSAVICLAATGLLLLLPGFRDSSAGLLLATFLRMGAAFGVVLVVDRVWPDLTFTDFYVWLALIYLFSIFLDAYVVMASLPLTRKVQS